MTKIITQTKNVTNSKPKKQQDDRLLKQLSRMERKQQEALRQLIMKDFYRGH